MPRTKYRKWKKRYKIYSVKRRKSKKERRILTRSLLKLLAKLDTILDQFTQDYNLKITKCWQAKRKIIKQVYAQQYQYFTTGLPPKIE